MATPPSTITSTPLGTDDPGARGAKRGAQVAFTLFLLFASWFVVSSTWQIIRGVFIDPAVSSDWTGPRIDPQGKCAMALRRLSMGVDRGMVASAEVVDAEGAAVAFRRASEISWKDEAAAHAICSGEPGGENAFAIVGRLHKAGETVTRRRALELGEARADVAAILKP